MTARRYIKKPIPVWAVQYTDEASVHAIMAMAGTRGVNNSPNGLYIETLEGRMRAKRGDYIIKGVRGEVYPCDRAIFEETYEEAPLTP